MSETVETIGGFVTDHLGHVPRRGEFVEVDGVRFEIQRADARRVHLLIVERFTSSVIKSKSKDDTGLDTKP